MSTRPPRPTTFTMLKSVVDRALVPALAVLLAGLAALAGCSNAPSRTAATIAAADSLGPPLVPISGDRIRALAAASGRPTLVNVWATWCAPCREEFPELMSVPRAHRADGLNVMLVSAAFDDQSAAVRKFLAGYGVRDTAYLKTGGDQDFINGIDPAWTGAIPATLVLDASGKVVAFWEGRA